MNKLVLTILLSLFVSLALVSVANAKLSMRLDAAMVPIGQTFHLTLIDDNPSPRQSPDLTPLQKDFTVVGTQQMANYTVINGQAQSMNQWILLLTPKHTGVLKIPPIAIGQEKTQGSQIEVTEANHAAPQQQDGKTLAKTPPVKFVTEVSTPKPYVNQQVIYTVKIYINRRLLNADYQPPQVKDALMVPMGETQQYQTTENGIYYTVDELQYALFPQKSGILKITPPQFRALVFDAIPGNIQIEAKTTSLNVQPAPPLEQKVSWLPAKQVILQEAYDNQSASIDQGTMIVRTITLTATGAVAQLLPRLQFETNNQFSVYPEIPTEETHYQQPDLVGKSVIKVTYLFNKSGSIVIPMLKLPWFNTVNGQSAVASLPARTIQVVKLAVTKTSAPAAAPTQINQAPSSSTLAKKISVPDRSFLPQSMTQNRLPWFVAAGFSIIWLLTLLLWWRSRTPHTGNRVRKARQRVRLACRRNNPVAAKEALIDWATKIWPEAQCFNLADVESLVGASDLQKDINTLSQHLYKDKKKEWQGTKLDRSFAAYKPEKVLRQKKEKNPLPPINP